VPQAESARALAGEARAAAATKRAEAAEEEVNRQRAAERETDGRFHRAELEAMRLCAALEVRKHEPIQLHRQSRHGIIN
jgi:hypothetical protein